MLNKIREIAGRAMGMAPPVVRGAAAAAGVPPQPQTQRFVITPSMTDDEIRRHLPEFEALYLDTPEDAARYRCTTIVCGRTSHTVVTVDRFRRWCIEAGQTTFTSPEDLYGAYEVCAVETGSSMLSRAYLLRHAHKAFNKRKVKQTDGRRIATYSLKSAEVVKFAA